MAEYVERARITDALLDNTSLEGYDLEEAVNAICAIPAADVRPVVLCRDCVHARRYTSKIKCGYWSEQTASEIVCEDDFCSYGEKREGS